MEDSKFISHSQLSPPTTVPRQGLGLFSVLAIVVAVLGLAFTGGLFLLKKSNDQLFCSKRDKGCLDKKFSRAKESLDFDLQNQNDWEFFKKRISYGACQAFWASKAEHQLSQKK